jgi:IMP cyclohydrolase
MMNNPNGPYPGRQLFLGMTVDGKPAFTYLVTGRSAASRERKATPMDDSIIMGPVGNAGYDWLRHYMAIKIDNSIGLMTVTNGIQTEAVFEMYKLLYHTNHQPDIKYIKQVMDGADYEPDSISTPRISGVIINPPGKTEPVYYASIVTNGKPAAAWEVKPKAGMFYGVSTYHGNMEKPGAYNIVKGPTELNITARNPQGIANFIYDISAEDYQGEDIRVCAIAGIREGTSWITALINMHEGTGCRIVGVG